MELEFFKHPPKSSHTKVFFLITLFLIVFALIFFHYPSSPLLKDLELDESEFQNFISLYNKIYKPSDYLSKFKAFRDNLHYIRKHNSLNHSWKLGINEFADMSPEEFAPFLAPMPPRQPKPLLYLEPLLTQYPESVDWRTKGIVSQVRFQGTCGSCYAFSAAGAIEGAFAIKTGKLQSLSIQQFVDCSSAYGNEGCNGGWMDYAFEYAMRHSIAPYAKYEYLGKAKPCQFANIESGVKIAGYVDVPPYSYKHLAVGVAKQPVSIAVDASTWQLYSTGVIDKNCKANLNHAVLAVGYELSDKGNYLIFKNSWGLSWGENGFGRVAMQDGQGVCGINMNPSYPVV